ncbi:DUF4998 domain-containing protein [Seonamhaeicola sp.]|uniref:DUF4998 domain-containing protein n=1 Tax=Seonamhaeicola sp. TaxID=1912245 RepID=UPI002635D7BA|nr:DUF4998 domain-containing protein [Seonamhaeicola sp.]
MKYIFILPTVLLLFVNCTDTNELHQKYLDRGETIYTEKPDSLVVFKGNNRVKVQWYQYSDLSIKKGRVYWNNRADSIDIDINITPIVRDEVSIIIPNLEEGSYIFEVFSMDSKGNRSVPVAQTGRSLGSNFITSLNNRRILSHVQTANDITFNMSTAIFDDYITNSFTYYNLAGELQTVSLTEDNLDSITIALTDIDITKNISYRSEYLPDGNAIDTFYTGYVEYHIQ